MAEHNQADSLRILVIDDYAITAMMMRLMLEQYGHRVEVAHSGTAALEIARRFRPNVVFCDLALPDIDGHAIAAELRRDPTTAAVRLIAVSGYTDEETRRRSREAGFNLYLQKPINTDELERYCYGDVR